MFHYLLKLREGLMADARPEIAINSTLNNLRYCRTPGDPRIALILVSTYLATRHWRN